jgi:hypothetical protein
MGIFNIKLEKSPEKFAFMDSNRDVNPEHIVNLKGSLKTYGDFMSTIKVSRIPKEVQSNKFFDAVTGEEVKKKDYKDYYVVVDGQHRVKAWLDFGKDIKDIRYEDLTHFVDQFGLANVTTELNRAQPLTAVDMLNLHKGNKDLYGFYKAINQGYSPAFCAICISTNALLNGNHITNALSGINREILNADLLSKVIDALPKESQVGRFYNNTMFPELIYKKKRAVFRANREKGQEFALNRVLDNIKNIDPMDLNRIKNAKSVDQAKARLNEAYENVVNKVN